MKITARLLSCADITIIVYPTVCREIAMSGAISSPGSNNKHFHCLFGSLICFFLLPYEIIEKAFGDPSMITLKVKNKCPVAFASLPCVHNQIDP